MFAVSTPTPNKAWRRGHDGLPADNSSGWHWRLCWLRQALAVVALLGLTALPEAAAQAVRCLDRSGATHTLAKQPDAAYSFFVQCEPLPPPTAMAQAAALRTAALLSQSSESFSVAWPSPRKAPPSVGRRSDAVARAVPTSGGERKAPLSARAEAYLPVIRRIASNYDLNPHYLKAMMHTESAFNRYAVSPKGAVGLMQLMPATARRFGVSDPEQLRDPDVNVEAAARYLAYLRRLFKNDWVLITAAYNAGEGAVRRYGNTVPPFAETQKYVQLVDARMQQYTNLAAQLQ